MSINVTQMGVMPSHAEIPNVQKTNDEKKLWEQAKKFEKYFVSMIFDEALKTSQSPDAIGGNDFQFWQSRLVNDFIENSPQEFGIAENIYKQMSQTLK